MYFNGIIMQYIIIVPGTGEHHCDAAIGAITTAMLLLRELAKG
jgi:hypothetical protein